MAAGGGVSERGSPPERGRRRPVIRPHLLRGPPHDPGGAGRGAGRAFHQGPGAGRRASAPGSTWARGRRCAATGGSRRLTARRAASAGPAGTAWCASAAASRPPLFSSPAGGSALQRTPGGGGGSPGTRRAPLLPRALAPFGPPPAGIELRAAAAAALAAVESRPRTDWPVPPSLGHLLLMPAGRLRPGPAPSRWGSVGGPPRHALRASPPTAPRAQPLPRRPPAPPGAGSRGAWANRRPGSYGGRGEC